MNYINDVTKLIELHGLNREELYHVWKGGPPQKLTFKNIETIFFLCVFSLKKIYDGKSIMETMGSFSAYNWYKS